MPDKRSHRGAHPQDAKLFHPSAWPALKQATSELSWLLSRGYAEKSALKLVGDRHGLRERQRVAVLRCACSDADRARRHQHEIPAAELAGQKLLLDGYNVLLTVEAALAGGVLLVGRDGCYRDLASVHGSYRRVEETLPALRLLGETLANRRPCRCEWYLDRPVSNSGRLKSMMQQIADEQQWNWQIELVNNPDDVLASSAEVIATADSVVLNRCVRWYNLIRETIVEQVAGAYVVDLSE